jgi:phosphoribosylformylglycinamidine cyclo-ligase
MYDTFNMGIGFVVIVAPETVKDALDWFESRGIAAYQIGSVVPGKGEVLGLTRT